MPDPVAPSRERGLKHDNKGADSKSSSRSLTGAWVETLATSMATSVAVGRSLTGAWVETKLYT